LNIEKSVITNLRKKFLFLGASIVKINKNTLIVKSGSGKNRIRRRETPRLQIGIPISELRKKFIEAGFLKVNKQGQIVSTARKNLLNLSHYDILTYYNNIIFGLLNFYSFANNYSKLHTFIWYIRDSCALTFALKYKLKTKRKAYKKFGTSLTCLVTDKKLYKPQNFHVKHKYSRIKYSTSFFDSMKIDWSHKLTNSAIFKKCILCGSSLNVEMHHYRSIKNVRNRIKTGNRTFRMWQGAVKRKQIPLCQYHHNLYHNGELNFWDIKQISEYSQ